MVSSWTRSPAIAARPVDPGQHISCKGRSAVSGGLLVHHAVSSAGLTEETGSRRLRTELFFVGRSGMASLVTCRACRRASWAEAGLGASFGVVCPSVEPRALMSSRQWW